MRNWKGNWEVRLDNSTTRRAVAQWRKTAFRSLWLALILSAIVGCGGPPRIAKGNVKLVEQLRTAVAAKRMDWLESAAKQVQKQRSTGQLSEEEDAWLEPMIVAGRQGHWDEANGQMLHW